jgi:hypothetical protein
MEDARLKEFEKHHRDLSDARIHEELEKYIPESAERLILRQILDERREAAEAGEKERFDKMYAQTERHHRHSVRLGWIAAGISLLGALAAWASSLWQTQKNLEYSRLQFELTKRPAIQVSSFTDDQLHLLNIGGAELQNVQPIAILAVYYREETEAISRVSISAFEGEIAKHDLRSGESLAIPFQQLTTVRVGNTPEADEKEAFAAVFRFYRKADRRPFFKIVSFIRRDANEGRSPPQYLYFPLTIIPGSALGGPNRPVLLRLKKDLHDLCVERLGLDVANDEA